MDRMVTLHVNFPSGAEASTDMTEAELLDQLEALSAVDWSYITIRRS